MFKRFCATIVAACLFVPAVARADNTTDGGIEFTLAGLGSSNEDVDAGSASVDAGIGFFIGPMFSLGARQSVSYNDDNAGTDVNASTRLFADLQFNIGRIAPFVGANVGYVYGESVHDTWAAGPEAGLKVYFGETTDVFVFGRVEYQFFFEDSDDIDNVFDDGSFNYSLGIGMRF